MREMTGLLRVLLCVIMAPPVAHAASPEETAREIKTWRENCSDPDPDLQIGYLTAVLETKNQTMIRACLRPLLTSDNADTRNLSLRAALATSERLTLTFALRKADSDAIAAADSTQAERVEREFQVHRRVLSSVNGNIGLTPKSVALDAQKSTWATYGTNVQAIERGVLELSAVGDRVTGNGGVSLGRDHSPVVLTINLQLDNVGKLVGEGAIDGMQFAVEIPLL